MGLLPTFAPRSGMAQLQNLYLNTPMPAVMAAPRTTLGQRITDAVSHGLQRAGMGGRHAARLGGKIGGALDALTPVGSVSQAQDARAAYSAGNYGSAALNGIGALLGALPDGGGMFAGKAASVLHSIIAPLWHGSPHQFEKFALEKIGTGEGAQAYGHGLYFAENPQVAEEYKQKLARPNISFDGQRLAEPRDFWAAQDRLESEGDWRSGKALNELFSWNRQGLDADAAFKEMRSAHSNDPKMLAAIDAVSSRANVGPREGHLYEVSLDANPEDFLNWDAPLSEQPQRIKELLPQIVHPDVTATRQRQILDGSLTGPGVYHAPLSIDQRSALPASEAWRQAGIPGLRYLDQGSRTAGQGTHNYVVFDPSIIDILNRH